MKVDLDACLAAGMNDHVTKPIDRRALVATLRRWLPAAAVAIAVPQRAPAAPPATVAPPRRRRGSARARGRRCERHAAASRIDRASLERMLLRFADGQREILEALRAAVVTGDGAMAARHAHAIAGAWKSRRRRAARRGKSARAGGREGRTDLTDLLAVVEERAAVASSIETLRPPAIARPTPRAALRSRGGRRRARSPDRRPGQLRRVVGERSPGRSRYIRPSSRGGR